MFYDDVRALKQIYKNGLEESISEVSPFLLLDISALTLRCASRWLAAEQSYVWSRALDIWNQQGHLANAAQNLISGGTLFELEDRREILQKAAEDVYQTLFRIEELLLDIGKLQSEESARRSMASARVNNVLVGSTPIRRIESTTGGLLKATKNWMTLVYHARESVWKALDIEADRQTIETVFKRNSFTQNASTRIFVGCVLHTLARPRPGSVSDFRGPPIRYAFRWLRTPQDEKLILQAHNSSSAQNQVNLPITSAFTSSQLGFHYPFWDNSIAKSLRYASYVSFGVTSLFIVTKARPGVMRTALESTQAWFTQHLLEPFKAMVNELFFNQQPRTSSREAAQEAQESLDKMLSEYRGSRGLNLNVKDMRDISREYEKAIVTPIKDAISGDLIRLGLIQAQALKAETLHLATELDDLMAENHFNSQLLATMPAIGMLGFVYNGLRRLYRWIRDESNSRESAKLEMRMALWDIEMLLIREDDGPSLFSYITSDDRGSEAGGSENWVQNAGVGGMIGASGASGLNPDSNQRRASMGSNPNIGMFDFDADEDLLLQSNPYMDENMSVDPITKYRRQLAGQMICTLHHLINLLIRSRNVLFRAKDREWYAAMRDVNYLFAREGWTAHARLELARGLRMTLMNL